MAYSEQSTPQAETLLSLLDVPCSSTLLLFGEVGIGFRLEMRVSGDLSFAAQR